MNPVELREMLRLTVQSYLHPEAALIPSLHILLDGKDSIDEQAQMVLAEMCGVDMEAVEKLLRHYAIFQKPQPACAALCFGTVCYLRGAKELHDSLRLHLSSSADSVEEVSLSACLGHCYAAPVFRMKDGTLHQVLATGAEG